MKLLESRDPRVENISQEAMGLPRRGFLRQLAGGGAAAAVLPHIGLLGQLNATEVFESRLVELQAGQAADERFWRAVRDLYPLRSGLVLLNAANLCPSPYPVMEAEIRFIRDVNIDTSFQNRAKFSEIRERIRGKLATYVGADPDEIAIVHNTTAANNQVVWGLDYTPGDEVVVWSQNHPTNNIAWDVVARRYGLVVHKVDTPADPSGVEALVRPFMEAMNTRTKVLALTHLSNVSGVLLPVRELCAMARQAGVLTLVDGVQVLGALRLDLHAIGCDFYTASSHKWLTGPRQEGLLYVRRERIPDLWPSVVGVGYGPSVETTSRKFETLGQRNDATLSAIEPAVDLHNRIGPDRVEARVRELATAVRDGIASRVPSARFHTPADPDLRGGVVIFNVPGHDQGDLMQRLFDEFDVACARMSGEFDGIRFSPHIYNTRDQIEYAVDAVARLAAVVSG
jgi:selenocysteine lyase/cysteine desulfurase